MDDFLVWLRREHPEIELINSQKSFIKIILPFMKTGRYTIFYNWPHMIGKATAIRLAKEYLQKKGE